MPRRNKKIVNSTQAETNTTPIFAELQRGVIEIISVTPPQAGGSVTISLPVGGHTYEKIIVSNNIPEDKITEVKVLVDDKTIWEFDNATQLRDLAKRYDETLHPATGSESAMTFNFERPYLNTLAERKLLGLGTLDIQKASIRFKIDSSVVDPEVSVIAFVGKPAPLGLTRIIRTVPFNSAVAGELSIVNPFLVNKTNQAKVMAAHLLRNDISSIKIMRGDTISHNYNSTINKYNLLSSGRVPDNKTFTVDFCGQNTIAGALTYSDTTDSYITLKPVVPSAGSCNILVEYIGTLGSA